MNLTKAGYTSDGHLWRKRVEFPPFKGSNGTLVEAVLVRNDRGRLVRVEYPGPYHPIKPCTS